MLVEEVNRERANCFCQVDATFVRQSLAPLNQLDWLSNGVPLLNSA